MVPCLILVVLFQAIIILACHYSNCVKQSALIKWNVSVVLASIVIMHMAIVIFNYKTGNIDPFYRSNLVGRLTLVALLVLVVVFWVLLAWFAFLCFTKPESIKVM